MGRTSRGFSIKQQTRYGMVRHGPEGIVNHEQNVINERYARTNDKIMTKRTIRELLISIMILRIIIPFPTWLYPSIVFSKHFNTLDPCYAMLCYAMLWLAQASLTALKMQKVISPTPKADVQKHQRSVLFYSHFQIPIIDKAQSPKQDKQQYQNIYRATHPRPSAI